MGSSAEQSSYDPGEDPEPYDEASDLETDVNEDTGVSSDDEKNFKDSEGLSVEFVISNDCKEDIGMISILDPVTDEQVDIGNLPDGKILKFTLNWPADKTDFNMAVYNINGDLVSESKIDVTGVTEKVNLLLSGDHNVENVEAQIK